MSKTLTNTSLAKIRRFFNEPTPEGQSQFLLQELARDLKFSSAQTLCKHLVHQKVLNKYLIKSQRGDKRYYFSSRTDLSPYEVVFALWSNAYFCNLTAVFYHNLTNQVPSVIYMAKEGRGRQADRPEKKRKITLTNENIFQAFIKPHRVTSNQYKLPNGSMVLTERVFRDEIGVISVSKKHALLSVGACVTSFERTLIDACVNPQYNGGISSVIDYYREAKGRVNGDKLIEIYKHLSYVYPYWQAIGFICEKMGIKKVADAIYNSFKAVNEFYLDHNAKTSWDYDKKWKLHYPRIF